MSRPRKPSRPVRRRKRTGRRWLLLAAIGALFAIFGAGFVIGGFGRGATDEESAEIVAQSAAGGEVAPVRAVAATGAATAAAATRTPVVIPELPPARGGARVAIVVDDLGRSLADLDTLRDLGVPITYAVLPFESMTGEVAERLRERGAEMVLHLPMDPEGSADPGPGALRAGMSADELRERTEDALEAVEGAAGVNNHMGSELTADSASMRAVLEVIGARDLFWLDSRTTAASVGYRSAVELGIPAAERQVFLDDDPRFEAVVAELRRLFALANERGAAIAIGHPHPATLRALRQEIPAAQAAGYEFVPVSFLLDREPGAPE